MAYTGAPETQTYSTQMVELACGIDQKISGSFTGFSKDQGMINVMPFKHTVDNKEEIWGETRYVVESGIIAPGATGVVRGMHVWEKTAGTIYYFIVVGTAVYSSTLGIANSFTQVNTLLTAGTGPVRFTEYIDDVNTKKLILVDGVEGYVYTTNAAGTKITDVDFPTPHVPWPVFMDGYLFLAKAGTGDIYNSNLNDPAAWTAGSFLSSELYPDDIQALLKVNNYILAVGTQGCEYFYDAANATASPLARYEGGSLPFGTQFPNSIAVNKNTVILIANSNDGESSLKIIEEFKTRDIVSSFVINTLGQAINAATATYQSILGFFLRQKGELFYGLTYNHTLNTAYDDERADLYPTLVYSFTTGGWTEFRMTTDKRWPFVFTHSNTTGKLRTYTAGTFAGVPFFGTYSGTGQYDTTSQQYQVYEEIRTAVYSFGTLNRKMCFRVGLVYGRTGDSGTSPPDISYTDDDWRTTSTARAFAGKNSDGDGGFPFLTQLGSFRQRGFKLSCTGQGPTVWKRLEVDINKGQQ